ncbi:MAG: flagellar biosynthetic protein FliR [Betaproteobacteria bacterium]|jgi:flagellar biosynthetic protein FliR|nr:flagellar biosynthetic protein FliR [Betaproteobacteria bacterium]
MDLLAADIVNRFYTFLWPMLRISALLLTAPLFSISAVPRRVRVLAALALTWFIYPLVEWPLIDPMSAPGLVEIVNQIFIGCVMGLTLQVVVAAVVTAGQALANAIGLSMATLIDPTLGNVPILSQFLLIMAVLIFVGTGGHLLLLSVLLKSFSAVPIGQSMLNQAVWGKLIAWSSMIFTGALLISLPVMAVLLLINAGLGVVTRAAPSLNIFAVGFPAMMLVGILACMLTMESMGLRLQWLWVQAFGVLDDLMGVR